MNSHHIEIRQPIVVGSDHAGFALKSAIVAHLEGRGLPVRDLGPAEASRVDYPDFGHKVARAIAAGEASHGVLVCGTGIGISIAANKVPGVRAALCHDAYTARMARAHNDAQIICLGSRVLGEGVAIDAVDAFFATAFEGGRHAARVAKIEGT
jgi:ribose 5-phosphate isomerase B